MREPEAAESPRADARRPADGRSRRWALVGALVLVVGLPLAELGAHAVARTRVVSFVDWARAAEVVEGRLRERDAVLSAPPWTDPMLRASLGRRIPLRVAGLSDLSPFERVWLLSIRGSEEVRNGIAEALVDRPPAFDESVGPIRVRRWDLGPSPVLADLVTQLSRARVTLGDVACPWRAGRSGRGGGLGAGPLTPAERFVCDPRRPWLWVGATVTEDLDLAPRRCVWQHPEGTVPVRTTFRDVPLGERIVVYAGLYYEHERERTGGPVVLRVLVDGAPIGILEHRDGDGWKRLEARMPDPSPGRTGTVAIEVTSRAPHLRSLCWAATTQLGTRPREPEGAE